MPRSWWRFTIFSLVATVAIEVVTCLFRFGLKLQSTRDTASLARYTLGLRIHHGYFGIMLLLACLVLKTSRTKDILIILGVSLVLSDAIHHVLVLWPITGSPQFDVFYR